MREGVERGSTLPIGSLHLPLLALGMNFVGLKRWVNKQHGVWLGAWICARSLRPTSAVSATPKGCPRRNWPLRADVNRSYMSKLEKGASSQPGDYRQALGHAGDRAGRIAEIAIEKASTALKSTWLWG
jgi:hypothetical protein